MVRIVDRETGLEADPVLVDRVSGRPLSDPVFRTVVRRLDAGGPA